MPSSIVPEPPLAEGFGLPWHRPVEDAVAEIGAFDLEPRWTTYPSPVPAQIGGVARASGPVPLGFVARGSFTT